MTRDFEGIHASDKVMRLGRLIFFNRASIVDWNLFIEQAADWSFGVINLDENTTFSCRVDDRQYESQGIRQFEWLRFD